MDTHTKQEGGASEKSGKEAVANQGRKGRNRSASPKNTDNGADITLGIVNLLVDAQEMRNSGARNPDVHIEDLVEIRRYVQYRLGGHNRARIMNTFP